MMPNIKNRYVLSVLSLTTLLAGTSAFAQSGTATLQPIIVSAQKGSGTKTLPSNATARDLIQQTPGGVAVVDAKDYEDKYALNFEDTLALTPGVYAQKRFGEEVRISIRGSGLSRGFHLRGLSLLQDGIPFNLADGASDFQEADSLAFQRLEVYKGANALQYGGTTLGGAINMVSKTGKSQPGDQLRLETGTDATYRVNVQSGRVFENSDLFLSLTGTTSNGFRQHDDQENIKFNSNLGYAISDKIETRFYLSGNIIDQELPGSVSLANALHRRKLADPSAITADQHRNIRSVRLSNKTTFDIGDNDKLDVGAFFNIKDLFHPITPFIGVIDQESNDYGMFAQASGEYELSGHDNRYRLGMTAHLGDVDAKVFQNINGSRGALTTDSVQSSQNYLLYGENDFYITPVIALVTGAQLSWADRDIEDNLNPAKDDSKIYRSFNPKVGVLYEPAEMVQFFANISKSHETSTFTELTQGGAAGFTPVDAQKAWTAEIGTRGEQGRFSWEASLYRAWLKGEMLQFTTGAGIPAETFNAEDTIHQGAELGFVAKLGDDVFSQGDSLQWRNAYTYSDYYFKGDQQHGDNDIPGQPKHFYQTEIRYDHGDDWHVGVDLELASRADVDFANNFEAPGYGVVGLNAEYKVNENVNLYLDARNLLDQEYVSTFSAIVNTAGNTAVFYPGEGRSAFAGVRIKF